MRKIPGGLKRVRFDRAYGLIVVLFFARLYGEQATHSDAVEFSLQTRTEHRLPKRRPLDYGCSTDDTDTTTTYDGPIYTTQTPLGKMGKTTTTAATTAATTPQRPTEDLEEDERAQQKEGTTVSSAATLDIDDAALVDHMADVPATGTSAGANRHDDDTFLNVSHNTGATASTTDTTNNAEPPPTIPACICKVF